MKKGSRRKANQRRNRALVVPNGIKRKKLRKNPMWAVTDQKALRKMANQAIGMTLMNALNIDFIGIMETLDNEKRDKPLTDTLQ